MHRVLNVAALCVVTYGAELVTNSACKGSVLLQSRPQQSKPKKRLFDPIGKHHEEYRELLEKHHEHLRADSPTDCWQRLAPSALYIGGGRSGSTSLSVQISEHPHLSCGQWKEHQAGMYLFDGSPVPAQLAADFPVDRSVLNGSDFETYLAGFKSDYEKYVAGFTVPCDIRTTLDFSPGIYLLYAQPELVRHYLGSDLKLIVMLRDPFDFMESLRQDPSDQEWLQRVEEHGDDCYAKGLETWLQYFPKHDFLFIRAEDYFKDQQVILDEVFRFLNVEPLNVTFVSGGRRRAHKRSIPVSERRAYHSQKRLVECKKRLEVLTGLDFPWPGSS